MSIKKTTKIVTFAIIPLMIILVLVYDVFAIIEGGSDASISSLIISWAYKMPFGVYMIGLTNGILVGHLFWRMKGNKDTIELDQKAK